VLAVKVGVTKNCYRKKQFTDSRLIAMNNGKSKSRADITQFSEIRM
jgi:hypothetical protein